MADLGDHAATHRQLARALDDIAMLRSFVALLPYAVPRPRPVIPAQRRPAPPERVVPRRPVDLWPVPRLDDLRPKGRP